MNFVIDLGVRGVRGVFVRSGVWLLKGTQNFFLSHVRNETKNNFLYFFIELKTYHLSYHLSEFEGLKFESSWRRKNIYTSNVLVFNSGWCDGHEYKVPFWYLPFR